MDIKPHIAEIDRQIAKLEHAKTVLLGLDSIPAKGKRERPKGSGTKEASTAKGRKLSAEARAKIAAAQKKRWAAAKKRAAA
jgi:hypothetical protein